MKKEITLITLISFIIILVTNSVLADIQMTVPELSQRGEYWSNDQLGTCSPETIGSHGCAITCTSMVLGFYGNSLNPRQMNNWLNQNNGYSGGCLVKWSTVAGYANNVNWIGSYNYQTIPADLNKIKDELDAGYPVIAEVRLSGYQHFVVITGYSGTTYYINDPWYGDSSTINSRYHANPATGIYGIRIYHGTGGNSSVNPTIAQTPMSGPAGTTFAQWGTDFTPNSTATMHFRKPDGTEYPTVQQPMDNTGHFDIQYTAPTNKPPGIYTWWVFDGPTGVKSNEVSYEITSSGNNEPGGSCGSGKVWDCAMNCVSASQASAWIGDNYCDDGTWGLLLTCPAFNNDGGDCDPPSDGQPGDSCGSGKVYDCAGNCVNAAKASAWIGDGYCDDGTWGMVLTCSAFNNDGGDCGGSSSGSPGSSCGSNMVYDCAGNCVNASVASNWTGDGYCDDGTWGMVLTCSTFNNDGGDCQ